MQKSEQKRRKMLHAYPKAVLGPENNLPRQVQFFYTTVSKFNFDLNPHFNPKMRFFHFFKSLILWVRYHQISSVAVSVKLTEFLDNIF